MNDCTHQLNLPTPIKLTGWELYTQVFKSAKYILAPMVDQSEEPWRLLSKRYGCEVCYTPMFHARLFRDSAAYRTQQFSTSNLDRPLVVQFCANDPDILLAAAQLVQDQCDAVDLNLGCPQGIARRGHYGSFLMDDFDLVFKLVHILHLNLNVPVTCKIRVFNDVNKTIEYAKLLESAGCQILTVHGRLREQKGQVTGLADWAQIKAIKQAVSIPVFANGNIIYFEDIQQCIAQTGVDGVMCAEANLYNPAIFADLHPPVWQIAHEYLSICKDSWPSPQMHMIRSHLFKLFIHLFREHGHLREKLARTNAFDQFQHLIDTIQQAYQDQLGTWDVTVKSSMIPNAPSGYKELPIWVCQSHFRAKMPHSRSGYVGDLSELAVDMHVNGDSGSGFADGAAHAV